MASRSRSRKLKTVLIKHYVIIIINAFSLGNWKLELGMDFALEMQCIQSDMRRGSVLFFIFICFQNEPKWSLHS